MNEELLLANAKAIMQDTANESFLIKNSRAIAFLLDNCEITIPEMSEFFVKVNCRSVAKKLYREQLELQKAEFFEPFRMGALCRAYSGRSDFGHTAPGWERIIRLGIPGLRKYIETSAVNPKNPDFLEAERTVFDAAERFLLRAADAAQAAGKTRMADGIRNLTRNAPANLYEGFQLTIAYYNLQQYFDGTDVRTMGRLDSNLYHLFQNESDSDYAAELCRRYLQELHSIHADANMPFALGGSDEAGNSRINALSYALLRAYTETKCYDVKLHILCTEDMPEDFLRICMESIRNGGNSFVFMNDSLVVKGLQKLGLSGRDARNFAVVGCYESCGKEEVPCSCNARVTISKALEYALHNGMDVMGNARLGLDLPVDFPTYEDLYTAFTRNLIYLSRQAMAVTDEWESRYPRTHASPFFSASLQSCVDTGGDAYCDHAARYCNSSVNAVGLATAADSLAAIRKLVYEDKRLTLSQLIEILDQNWDGNEALRLYARNRLPKFGNGDKSVDAIAADIVKTLSDTINNAPNAKGGVYRLGLFSIEWRKDFGQFSAATPDGRKAGETLSQNTSCAFGADKEGPTGHILSVAALNNEDVVNGSVLDLELHSSAVRGSNGMQMMLSTLRSYFEMGGQTIHYNVLDTDTLRDAQIHPENHANLQVRLCGWNVLFTQLSKASQDEFIYRSELHRG